MSNELIRAATVEDLPKLAPLAAEFYAASAFLGSFDIDRFTATWTGILDRGLGVIFVSERAGEISGTIGGMVTRSVYGEDLIAEELFWFVAKDSRGGGLRLYRAFEAWARSRGAASLQMVHLLDVMPEKVAAFYLRAGFKPIETRYSKQL